MLAYLWTMTVLQVELSIILFFRGNKSWPTIGHLFHGGGVGGSRKNLDIPVRREREQW